jgi:DNA-binding MarR family transcriptional regulator
MVRMSTDPTPAPRATPGEFAAALERAAAFVFRLSPAGDLSLTSAGTLATLNRVGPYRLSELAAAERVSQPSMTALIARLERRGLVSRYPDPGDGRVVNVAITDAGRHVLTERSQARATLLAGVLDRLPEPERDALLAATAGLARLTEQREALATTQELAK